MISDEIILLSVINLLMLEAAGIYLPTKIYFNFFRYTKSQTREL